MKTLLAIGDEKDWDSYLKFCKQRRLLKRYQFKFVTTNYDSVLNSDFPVITTHTVVVFLFFPFIYWDAHIEPKKYAGAYGNREFYSKLKAFWKTVDQRIRKHYGDKKLFFVNLPETIPTERDKAATRRLLLKAGIRTPRAYRGCNVKRILALLVEDRNLFIKARYGSMGKGVTYLEKGKWCTNFGFRANKIVNRHSDYGWKFREITGNRRFLKELLKEDVVIEEAVPRWLIRGKQFDLRCLLLFGKVLYIYPRSNAAEKVTSNVSQGANSETMAFLKGVPQNLIRKAEKAALAAAGVLGLNFAGVDIMLDPDERVPIVIELNAFPGFPRVRTFNLARHLIRGIGERKWK